MFTLIQTGDSCKWANDSQHFLLENFEAIHDSPFYIYHIALPFCPSSSWLCECYAAEFSQEVKVVKGLQAEWGTCFRTIPFNSTPRALACWKDLIAVGLASHSSNIVILDAITGVHMSVLSGHTGWIQSLAFSLDGKLLVSGSDDETVNIWDIQTGGVVKTFHGHTRSVLSVSISLDQTTIISGSSDKTVRLWNVQTGECCHVIEQQDEVKCVSFSLRDPQCLMSASGDKVWKWNINGHQVGPVYDGSHVAFSLDGTQFVSYKGDTVTVQNSDSGGVVAEFHVANSYIQDCCLSSDGRLVAGAAYEAVYIWDISSSDPNPIKTFVGHNRGITSLVFSSFLISASKDRSVKFWQIGISSTDSFVTDTVSTSPTLPQIQSVTLQTMDGIAISSDSNGVVKTWDISTGLCKESFQTPAKDIQYIDAQLIMGKLVIVWHAIRKTYIWDAEKGTIQMLATPKYIKGLRISGDGSKVFTPSNNSIQAWSMQTGEALGEVEVGGWPYLDPLYVGGSGIWVCFKDSPTQGWDFGNQGLSPIPLSNKSSDRPHLDLIGRFADQHFGPVRVKDTVTGKEVFQLYGKYAKPGCVQWDGQYLVAGYGSGEVLILDFNWVLSH